MKALKGIGIFLLCVLLAAVCFLIALLVGSWVNHISIYETAQLWFGGNSAIGATLQKL